MPSQIYSICGTTNNDKEFKVKNASGQKMPSQIRSTCGRARTTRTKKIWWPMESYKEYWWKKKKQTAKDLVRNKKLKWKSDEGVVMMFGFL